MVTNEIAAWRNQCVIRFDSKHLYQVFRRVLVCNQGGRCRNSTALHHANEAYLALWALTRASELCISQGQWAFQWHTRLLTTRVSTAYKGRGVYGPRLLQNAYEPSIRNKLIDALSIQICRCWKKQGKTRSIMRTLQCKALKARKQEIGIRIWRIPRIG